MVECIEGRDQTRLQNGWIAFSVIRIPKIVTRFLIPSVRPRMPITEIFDGSFNENSCSLRPASCVNEQVDLEEQEGAGKPSLHRGGHPLPVRRSGRSTGQRESRSQLNRRWIRKNKRKFTPEGLENSMRVVDILGTLQGSRSSRVQVLSRPHNFCYFRRTF